MSMPSPNIVCSWCQAPLGWNPELAAGDITHGICETCRDRMLDEPRGGGTPSAPFPRGEDKEGHE